MRCTCAFLLVVSSASLALGCAGPEPKAPRPPSSFFPPMPARGGGPRLGGGASANDLMMAWFGCAIGDPWTAALETPPHTWTEHNLDRCHAVGAAVGPAASQLRSFVPYAVRWVSDVLEDAMSDGDASVAERLRMRQLFHLGTSAAQELDRARDAADELRRASETAPPAGAKIPPRDEAKVDPARAPLALLGADAALEQLWTFAARPETREQREAAALAWLVGLVRLRSVRGLLPDTKTVAARPTLRVLFGVDLPPEAAGATVGPDERWFQYVTTAATSVAPPGWLEVPAGTLGPDVRGIAEKEAYAELLRASAIRLREAAEKLDSSELKRAALGASSATERDLSEMAER